MGSGASRILSLMKTSGKNTISTKSYVTVHSLSPLTLKLDDKLILTSEFYVLSDDIIISRLHVGQKLLAFSFNDGQCYFVHQTVDGNIIKTKIIDNTNDNSTIDSLSANQGRLLAGRVLQLENEMIVVKQRLTSLESRMSNAETDIENIDNRVTSLESRIV